MSKNLLKTEDLPKPNSILVLSRIALQLKEMNAEFEIKADGVIIKSRKKDEPKQEWSEEDKKAIALIRTAVIDETRLDVSGKCIVNNWLERINKERRTEL